MSSRVYLHIGAAKTGTTYLQGLLNANRDALARAGVLFPAPLINHFRFMRHLLGRQGGAPPPKVADTAFESVVEQSRDHDGVLLLSNELLAAADTAQVQRVAALLAPAEVHIVYTVRDLARTLAAEWQQAVKGGSELTLDDFVDGVTETFATNPDPMPSVVGESQAVEKFTALHDVDSVLSRWARVTDARQVHVVTLPPAGSDPVLLWERFSEAIGLDPAVGSEPATRRNESLGAAEAETLRRINRDMAAGTGYDFARSEWVRQRFVLPVLMPRPSTERIALRDEQREWAGERAAEIVATLQDAQYDVIGDLKDLLPVESGAGIHPSDVPEETVAALATDWVATLLLLGRSRELGGDRPPVRASSAGH